MREKIKIAELQAHGHTFEVWSDEDNTEVYGLLGRWKSDHDRDWQQVYGDEVWGMVESALPDELLHETLKMTSQLMALTFKELERIFNAQMKGAVV